MMKVTRKGVSLLIPDHWLQTNGFIRHRAVHTIKLFFGEEDLATALEQGKRRVIYGWGVYGGQTEIKLRKKGE